MTKQKFTVHEKIGFEEITRYGLFRYNPTSKLLECPFIWLCINCPELLRKLYSDSDYKAAGEISIVPSFVAAVGSVCCKFLKLGDAFACVV